jgi:hypothetical protein
MSPAGALLLVANAHGLPEQFDREMDGYSRSGEFYATAAMWHHAENLERRGPRAAVG